MKSAARLRTKHRIELNANGAQWVSIFVCFALFFVLPLVGYSYYQGISTTTSAQETYTSDALAEVARKTGRVAGASTQTPNTSTNSTPTDTAASSYTVPVINYQFQLDFSKPENLIVLVGTIAALAAIVLFLGLTFDFFGN